MNQQKFWLKGLLFTCTVAACGRFALTKKSSHPSGHSGLDVNYVTVPERPNPSPKLDPNYTAPKGSTALTSGDITAYASCTDLKTDLALILRQQAALYWNQRVYQYKIDQLEGYSGSGRVVADSTSYGPTQNGPVANSSVAGGTAAAPNANSAANAAQVGTNLQVAGVDEGDDVKITSKALYIADNQQINGNGNLNIAVLATAPLAYQSAIQVPGLAGAQLYTAADTLLIAGMGYTTGPVPTAGYSANGYQFQIHSYDMTNLAAPRAVYAQGFDGTLVDSRLVNGKLVFVLKTSFSTTGSVPWPSDDDLAQGFDTYSAKINVETIFRVNDHTIDAIPCTSLLRFPDGYSSFNYQRAVSFDIASGKILSDVAIPGDDSDLYMTEATLYSIGTPTVAPTWVVPGSAVAPVTAPVAAGVVSSGPAPADSSLMIKKIAFDAATGILTPTALGLIPGHLKQFDPSWAFHEMDKNGDKLLAVVTTTGDVRDQSGLNTASNHLIVLQAKGQLLAPVATLDGFGNAEDVRSVRYADDQAYIVTFKRTDPLFVIDLKDPLAPKITGQLQIPGFSMYLQPDGAKHLVGLGYEAVDSGEVDINRAFFQGLLLQLFDVKDPTNPERLFHVDLGLRGSYSEATQNHHAFYYDSELALVGLPVVLFDDAAAVPSAPVPTPASAANSVVMGMPPLPTGQTLHYNREFSGAILYAIDGDALVEKHRVSHFDMLTPTCQAKLVPIGSWTTPIVSDPEVRRIFRVGSTIYTVSNFGVKTIDATSFADLAVVAVPGRDCLIPVVRNGNE